MSFALNSTSKRVHVLCFIAQLLAFFIDAGRTGRFTGADTVGLAFGHFGFFVFFPVGA